MQLWHCRTDWLLPEIHRSRPHHNFLQVTWALQSIIMHWVTFKISRSLLGERKIPKDIINTYISGRSAEDFVANPWKKQNFLVSGLGSTNAIFIDNSGSS